ncbi:hypothetical protein [Amycolatopsis sp. NPDC098790]|uniref:hypothetical protein n=1 Tax=Amycolatopsis sp. NPDC098790 TaxID=3363939 RepID=UPI0038027D20
MPVPRPVADPHRAGADGVEDRRDGVLQGGGAAGEDDELAVLGGLIARNSYLAEHADVAKKVAIAVQQATAYLNANIDSEPVQTAAQKALAGVRPRSSRPACTRSTGPRAAR